MESPPKSCSLDPLPTCLVRENVDVLAPLITQIINLSLLSGVVPKALKAAIVTPLLKKQNLDPNTLKNYRPVSQLPFVSKILEKAVLKQCKSFLTNNNLYEVNQSAYRQNHSTETTVLNVLEELLTNMDNRKVSLVACLDLSAAFDTIDHSILMTRLKTSFGFEGVVLRWFDSYLSARTQSVHVENSPPSVSVPLLYGVPQGSVLGPLLFTLYTQPLSDVISSHSCSFNKYADDTELSKSSVPDSFSSVQLSVQNCITDILLWMNSNKLKLNPEKTEAMKAGSKYHLGQTTINSMDINENSVTFLPHIKYLGVYLDSCLTMQRHISDVCRSTYLALRRVAALRPFLSVQSTATLVNATVTSRLDYCNSSFSGIASDQLLRLQRVQNSAARLVLKKRKRDHITPLLIQLHWLPLSFRIQYKLALFAYRHFENSLPQYMSDSLSKYNPSRTLRSSSKKLLHVPKRNLKYGDRSPSSAIAKAWNSLPKSLHETSSLSTFKSRLKTHLFKLAFLM